MISVHETYINGIQLFRDVSGAVSVTCRVSCQDSRGNTVFSQSMEFREDKNHDCRAARVFAKRLHRMVKERLLKEIDHLDLSAVRAELVDPCCGK